MKDNYGITKTACSFWVRVGWVVVNGKKRPWFQTTITYSKYENKELALDAARGQRDIFLKQWAVIDKSLGLDRRYKFKTKPNKTNKTGHVGVYITEYSYIKGNGWLKHARECIGSIQVNKVKYEISRSCLKYGDEKAIEMVAEWRKQKEDFFKKRPNVRMIK